MPLFIFHIFHFFVHFHIYHFQVTTQLSVSVGGVPYRVFVSRVVNGALTTVCDEMLVLNLKSSYLVSNKHKLRQKV